MHFLLLSYKILERYPPFNTLSWSDWVRFVFRHSSRLLTPHPEIYTYLPPLTKSELQLVPHSHSEEVIAATAHRAVEVYEEMRNLAVKIGYLCLDRVTPLDLMNLAILLIPPAMPDESSETPTEDSDNESTYS